MKPEVVSLMERMRVAAKALIAASIPDTITNIPVHMTPAQVDKIRGAASVYGAVSCPENILLLLDAGAEERVQALRDAAELVMALRCYLVNHPDYQKGLMHAEDVMNEADKFLDAAPKRTEPR